MVISTNTWTALDWYEVVRSGITFVVVVMNLMLLVYLVRKQREMRETLHKQHHLLPRYRHGGVRDSERHPEVVHLCVERGVELPLLCVRERGGIVVALLEQTHEADERRDRGDDA